ncbi:MAG: HAD family hydrolase [Eubacteriales bacterium]|nr:HAD family hydrolase [Eubacteriales bacterium]MDD3881010.1 HAD family hydrolase [Eubacteriales bacterium]MDD4511921.1 HAD family hydrolase [Eubacteriales bacterium]
MSEIKLVAIDLDGTLLHSDKSRPREAMEIFRELISRGVDVALASGRQYAWLRNEFSELADGMTFLCENGALLVKNEQRLLCEGLPHTRLLEMISAVRTVKTGAASPCTPDMVYYEADFPLLVLSMKHAYRNSERVSDVYAAVGDKPIMKISVYDDENAEKNLYPVLKPFSDDAAVVVSGQNWVDIMKKGVSKGFAMRRLMAMKSLRPEECMAFGDYMNDSEMMDAVYHSYGMANGHPDFLAHCRFRAPSNDEDGVLQVLKRTFGL